MYIYKYIYIYIYMYIPILIKVFTKSHPYSSTSSVQFYAELFNLMGEDVLEMHSRLSQVNPLQCVAVRCSVLQCVAVCCSALQCVAAC